LDRSEPDVHLNLNVRGMPSSATVAINERCNELLEAGRRVYKLGLGQSPFPVPEPVVAELRNQAFQKDYLPVRGLRQLREAVADYNHRSQGISVAPEHVLVGPGSKELMFLLQLVYYGDLVIPTPSWVSYAPQAHIIGRRVHWLRTHRENSWRLTPEELEKACRPDASRPRIVVLNYPSNPTGATYEESELEDLARVARTYRVVLLSDEIYGELHHAGRHVSISRFYPEGTIVSSGLSKWCGAGGWRLGTFSFPPGLTWLLDAMAAVASETYTSTSAPIQYAAVRAFQGGTEIERYLWNARRVLRALDPGVPSACARPGCWSPRPPVPSICSPTSRRTPGTWRRAASRRVRTCASACWRMPASRSSRVSSSGARSKSSPRASPTWTSTAPGRWPPRSSSARTTPSTRISCAPGVRR
jgi:aspartate aminotransferase